jgi:hypothetical protein
MKSQRQLEENVASAKMKPLSKEEQMVIEELMIDAS